MSAAISIIGVGLSFIGSMKQAKAAEKAEKLRKQQMKLESLREKREIVRRGLTARAEALSNASSQGAGEGSGLQGGIAQAYNQSGRGVLAVNQNEKIGSKIFDANAAYSRAGTLMAAGQGLQTLSSKFQSMAMAG
jgi:hypothetical protein